MSDPNMVFDERGAGKFEKFLEHPNTGYLKNPEDIHENISRRNFALDTLALRTDLIRGILEARYHGNGKSQQAIAEGLGISVRTVNRQLKRTFSDIRKQYKKGEINIAEF